MGQLFFKALRRGCAFEQPQKSKAENTPYITCLFLVVTYAFLVVTKIFLVVTEIHLAFT